MRTPHNSVLQRGFTMVELLVVSGVFVVMLVTAAILIHPVDYGPERRNALRWLYVLEINYALQEYKTEYGKLPDLPNKFTMIGSDNGQLDLCEAFVPDFLVTMPLDPSGGVSVDEDICNEKNTGYTTGLQLKRDADGTVTIEAPHAERGERISYVRKF
jgi:prepilin-type N-terminal cleavage/methylation domain-containing protein